VGAGLGSLTVALAEAGAEVLAIEFDRALLPALHEVVDPLRNVTVLAADALHVDWPDVLGAGERTLAANLPYNIAVPLLLRLLDSAPQVSPCVVMVQRELGDRLAASPGSPAYGAVSAKISYHADVETLRRVPREVFWPRPMIESSVLRLTRRRRSLDPRTGTRAIFALVDLAFGERRKTMINALRRLGLDPAVAARTLDDAGVDHDARAEDLGADAFASVVTVLYRDGVRPEAAG
jgi:16S rRNA (adenine1518-N6/adenine1519-N6)-dimethyltransferase